MHSSTEVEEYATPPRAEERAGQTGKFQPREVIAAFSELLLLLNPAVRDALAQIIDTLNPPRAPNLMLLTQPPAEPLCRMGVDGLICWTHRAKAKIIRPAGQFPIQPPHNQFGIQ